MLTHKIELIVFSNCHFSFDVQTRYAYNE